MIQDSPIIRNAEKYGTGGREPRCPVCGQECETVYKDFRGEIIGCDDCLTAFDAWEEDECMGYDE